MRFAVIGILNTALHFLLLVLLVEGAQVWPPAANAAAFLAANLFSYFANSRFNFRVEMSRNRYGRFLATSLMGAGLAYGLSWLAAQMAWHYLAGFALLVVVMPPLNYLLLRRLVFTA